MFFIIGGDGKEYGPVSAEQVKAWIGGGRANVDTTLGRRDGETQLRPLREFTEFYVESAMPVMTSSIALAGRGIRFLAAFLDGIFMTLCSLPAWIHYYQIVMRPMIEAAKDGGQPAMDPTALLTFYGYYACCLVVYAVIQSILICWRGQSLGKLIVGIRVVKQADDTKPGFVHGVLLRAIVPSIITMIPFLGTIFWLVDVCFIFGDQKRCVHDLIGGTKVVAGHPPAK